MGAEQSSSRNGRDGDAQESARMKRDFYEVLGIDRQATDDQIKKAYRRKALELHPDRNYGDVENATAQFAEVQSAYEVLSDAQERAWYDSHRDSILRTGTGGAEEADHYEHNVRLTSTSDILSLMSRLNSSVPFTDAPNGFYGIISETFANLAREEDAACDREGIEHVDYPEFGTKDDNYEDVVRPFYRAWTNFSTKKSFSWRDRYKASDAPGRATRRLVERENKKSRDVGIRDFNDAVRAIVAFVRKRDPRYIPNSQTEADRQRILRDAAAAQAARSRAANQAKLNDQIVADWARTKDAGEEFLFSETEEEEVEHIQCVVCGKTFKSERQYEAHEKSKKHQKAVQQLKRQMRKENRYLNLEADLESPPSKPVEEVFENLGLQCGDAATEEKSDPQHVNRIDSNGHDAACEDNAVPLTKNSSSEASDIDGEYGTREQIEIRLLGLLHQAIDSNAASVLLGDDGDNLQPKLGKAKAKRAKKAARKEAEIQAGQEVKCSMCNKPFPSKTKLFAHIKGHAQHELRAEKRKNKNNRFVGSEE